MADSQQPHFDEHDTLPPSIDPAIPDGVQDPPRGFWQTLKRLGPGLIIAGSIVGSGELIATTKTGAQAGIVLLWLIIIGCVIKVFVQVELGRYTIGHGETTLAALDQVPGPRLRVGWIVWFWLAMMLIGIGQLGGIVGGVGQAAALAMPISGDYADATRYPSADEIKTYLKWDDAVLSEWDLAVFMSTPPADAGTSRGDNDSSLHVHERRAIEARKLRVVVRVAEQLAWLEGHNPDLKRRLLERVTQWKTDPSARPGDNLHRQRSELLREANALLLQKAAAGEIDDEALTTFTALSEPRRKRLLRGHHILSSRMRELDAGASNRMLRGVAAVEELNRREATLEQLKSSETDEVNIQIAAVRVDEQKRVVAAILDPQTWDDKLWAGLIALITAALLYRGRYLMIQNIAMVLVVSFTFITIGNVISLQMTEQWHISAEQFWQGLTFQLPAASDGITPVATALATFGIIGVGASELIAYPYWCLEKGYAKFTGKPTDEKAWAQRARGWLRVMKIDAFASMVVYTIATLAFFLMGVAVLFNEGRDPDGMRMVSTLATAYVPVFGEYARWLFLAGAIAVLYSTFLVATAGNARMYTDSLKVYRLMNPHSEKAHERALSFFSVLLPLLCFAVYSAGINPVRAVLLAGAMQALLLPMIGVGALYFRFTRTDGRIKPSPVWDVLLIVSFIGLFLAGTYGAYKQIVRFF